MGSISRVHEHALVFILVLMALLARLPGITEPPLDFHPTRQYRSAILARALYYEGNPAIPEWQRQLSDIHVAQQGGLEPPIMETLTAWLYRLVGEERLELGHLIAVVFWLGAGIAVWLTVRSVGTPLGGLVALAFVLFAPYGLVASRSFQPESLMVLCVSLTVLALQRWAAEPKARSLIAVILAGGMAGLVKPSGLFFVAGPALGILAWPDLRLTGSTTLMRRGMTAFVILAGMSIPAFLYYGYAIWISGTMKYQLNDRFVPQLFGTAFYWLGWKMQVDKVVGGVAVAIVGLIGAVTAIPRPARFLACGLWGAYGLFAVISSYHIATHDYYSLPLVVIVGLSLGLLTGLVTSRLAWLSSQRAALVIAALMVIGSLLSVRATLPALTHAKARVQARAFEVIGEKVQHATDLIILDYAYGRSVMYHGLVAGTVWPGSADFLVERFNGVEPLPASERFQRNYAPSNPSFFVITNLHQLNEQPDLAEFLKEHARLAAEDFNYRIYDLRAGSGADP